MKKLIAIALAMLMVFALCACSGSVDTSVLEEIVSTLNDIQATLDSLEAAAPAEEAAAPAEEAAAPAEKEAAPAEESALEPKDGGSALTFTTGGDTGTYYALGSIIAGKVSETTSTSVTAIASGGSKANIEALEMGDAQLGFTQYDVMMYAYEGTNSFAESGAVDNFSVVAALYPETVQIVTLNPDIKSVADLEGKNVSIGASGSGVFFNAVDILSAYGLAEADENEEVGYSFSINPTFQSFGDSVDSLQDGNIDAAFIVAGAPTNAVSSLAATNDIYLISIDDEHLDQLIADIPTYTKATIPADVYGTPEDCSTLAITSVVIAADDVADEDVYNFLYGAYENLDELTVAHSVAGNLSLELASSITTVPYHPGAAAYYADKGIDVPVK